MDAGSLCWLEGLPGAIDVSRVAASQPGDHRSPNFLGDQPNRPRVIIGRDRKPSFHHIHTQRLELPGELELLAGSEREPWGLLAVAQGGVEDGQGRSRHGRSSQPFTRAAGSRVKLINVTTK